MNKDEIIPGTPVTYYSVIRGNEKLYPKQTVIASKPWELGGETVCLVSGKSGAVAITHLEKREGMAISTKELDKNNWH